MRRIKKHAQGIVVALLLGWIGFVVWESRPVLGGVASQLDRPLAYITDTVNCVNLYKPFPIVLPPGADSVITKAILQAFANHIDLQVDEVYLRVRDAICNLGVEIVDSLTCVIVADTIYPCSVDTLYLVYQGVAIRDTANDRVGASIKLYEDTIDGGQYAGFMVKRDDMLDPDTNFLTSSYFLVMPKDDGNPTESNSLPGGGNYGLVTLKGNSELLSDGTGNLFWMDRDWFPNRAIIDTIIADTIGITGSLDIAAAYVAFRADTFRAVQGEWFKDYGPVKLRFYEAMNNSGNNYITLRPASNLQATWEIILPDTCSRFRPSKWRFDRGTSLQPTWVPDDDQITIWGSDTVRGGTTSYTVRMSRHSRPLNRDPLPGSSAMPWDSRYNFYPTVEWACPDPDSCLAGDFVVFRDNQFIGRPAPSDSRSNELMVLSYVDEDAMASSHFNDRDPRYATDSTFIVMLPSFGSDTLLVIRWKVVGWVRDYLGEG